MQELTIDELRTAFLLAKERIEVLKRERDEARNRAEVLRGSGLKMGGDLAHWFYAPFPWEQPAGGKKPSKPRRRGSGRCT